MVTGQFVSIGKKLVKPEGFHRAYTKTVYPETPLFSPTEWTAYSLMRAADKLGVMRNLGSVYVDSISAEQNTPADLVFRRRYLDKKLNNVYNLPDVQVADWRPPTINVLAPAFDFNSASAGLFGVFQLARFLVRTGVHVRLVFFENFVFSEKETRKWLTQYPGMEGLFDEVEVAYIGGREQPLYVSPADHCVATIWYSAYFARKINNLIGRSKFLYLIQDYETNFYPGGSSFALADLSYEMDYDALFSTKALMELFIQRDIGGFDSRHLDGAYFNNPSSSSLPSEQEFIERKTNKEKRTIVFYSRPVVDRNMFELTALALNEAYQEGIFDSGWDCIGMGLGEGEIELAPNVHSVHLPRMTLGEYVATVSDFDICLVLMASSHPSLICADLAASGAIVVTNTFATKTAEYLKTISKNIIPVTANLSGIVAGLREAVDRVSDIDARWKHATETAYPRTWNKALTGEHLVFIRNWLSKP